MSRSVKGGCTYNVYYFDGKLIKNKEVAAKSANEAKNIFKAKNKKVFIHKVVSVLDDIYSIYYHLNHKKNETTN